MTTQEGSAAVSLVRILVAARRAGDRDLERQAKRELARTHGMKISFAREPRGRKGVADAR